MAPESARREDDVAADLLPPLDAARVARRLLLRFHAAELDSRRTLGRFARHAAPLEIVRAELDVARELVVHVALERVAADEMASECTNAPYKKSHSDAEVARRAAVIPATTCSQLERSSRSAFRPSGVSV